MKYTILVFALTTLLASTGAEAYRQMTCNNGDKLKHKSNGIHYRVDPGIFSDIVWANSLVTAALVWNINPSRARIDNITFWENNHTPSGGNGLNELYFATSVPSTKSAVTTSRVNHSTCRIVESDIRFNGFDLWIPDFRSHATPPYGGSAIAFIGTAMHEFGHSFALDHTQHVLSLMTEKNTLSASGGNLQPHVGEDAATGLINIYGKHPDNLRDVAVRHWRHAPNEGDPLRPARTRILCHRDDPCRTGLRTRRVGVQEIVSGNLEINPVYKVYAGGTYQVEFTYENVGKRDTETVDLAFYISEDNTIDTSDTRIDTHRYNLSRDVPWTTRHKITIPSNYPSGRAYLGVIVDYNNKIPEAAEWNNATYTKVEIKPSVL